MLTQDNGKKLIHEKSECGEHAELLFIVLQMLQQTYSAAEHITFDCHRQKLANSWIYLIWLTGLELLLNKNHLPAFQEPTNSLEKYIRSEVSSTPSLK